MLRRLLCLLVLVFTVTTVPARAGTPRITAITPMQYGYMIYGAGFGADRNRVAVIENSSALQPSAVIAVSDDRVIVRSNTTGELTIAVRVGDQVSSPVAYEVGHAPMIAAIAPTAGGYTIYGTDFGTDRGRVIVIQNNGVLPPIALTDVTDSRIEVRAPVAGTAMIAVRVGFMLSQAVTYAPGHAPTITAITPMFRGYAITGHNFGYDRRRITIAENGKVLPASALLAVTDGRIEVRSEARGALTVMIRVGAVLSTPATYRPPARMPIIASVAPVPEGYVVIGSGFGVDRSRVAVIENNAPLPARDILGLADDRIVVRSRAAGFVAVAVRVGQMVSRPMLYDGRTGEHHAAGRTKGGGAGGPTVSLIVPDMDGYTIVGAGFGTNRRHVAIIENGAVLPPGAIRTLTDSQIIVHSPSRAARLVAVRIGGATLPAHRVPAPLPPPTR